jgi:uncharacterized protein (TIGR02996 family)
MTPEQMLDVVAADPDDRTAWLALADSLEEHGQPLRAELSRLSLLLRSEREVEDRAGKEARVRDLLAAGVRPCLPELVNSIGMRFVLIPPGRFLMGSPPAEERRRANEHQREVVIRRPFYLSVFPITQTEHEQVTGSNPSRFCNSGRQANGLSGLDTSRFPVECITWDEAEAFCEQLMQSAEDTKSGRVYRLPAEVEWEYCCRGGASSTPFHFGPSLHSTQANFHGRFPYGGAGEGPWLERPCPVGTFPCNAFGLHDLHGNIQEWCYDPYEENPFVDWSGDDLVDPRESSLRVIRGGGWSDYGQDCRSAQRGRREPSERSSDLGFRVTLFLCGG